VVKLPPPAWAFLYLIAAGALSRVYPWRQLIDLRIVWLGVVLIAIGFAIAFWAISLFRLEGTELNPTSETNKSLIIRGSYRFTRNPIYVGLIVLTLGVAFAVGSRHIANAPALGAPNPTPTAPSIISNY
jgi:protein-S-isoprenylcysteine O-methyltransferase Ste14